MRSDLGRGRRGRRATLAVLRRWLAAAVVMLLAAAPATPPSAQVPAPAVVAASAVAATSRAAATTPSLDDIEHRTFDFFWNTADPRTGLVPDHWPHRPGQPYFSSVAAVGFALTAYPIGATRGWITREQARRRVLKTLRFLAHAPQGPQEDGEAGYHGFFYHFLGMDSGARYGRWVEVSTIDTTWLMAGVLFDASWFDQHNAEEREIRRLANRLYRNVDWTWAEVRPPLISMGWTPGGKFIPHDYKGYDEAMMLYILALGSPTHPIGASAWPAWTSTYKDTWGTFMGGKPHVGFAPLFGHQYTQAWIDMRGIQDAYMRRHRLTYFQNSRRSVIGQERYAVSAGGRFTGYGHGIWGLTASDGPGDVTVDKHGMRTTFHGYMARGADVGEITDDGTIAPTAAIASIVFAPRRVSREIDAMYSHYGEWLYQKYGFVDAFNPSFRDTDTPLRSGRVVPDEGWFDDQYLGIDQGPILLMIENCRSGMVWRVMRRNPYVRRGLERAGFTGGWLAPGSPLDATSAIRAPGPQRTSACMARADYGMAGIQPTLLPPRAAAKDAGRPIPDAARGS